MLRLGADSIVMPEFTSRPALITPATSRLVMIVCAFPIVWNSAALAADDGCIDWLDYQQASTAVRAEPAAGNTEGLSNEMIFGRITVRTGDLFDLTNEAENAFINTAANALHPSTRTTTVFNALPFSEGDSFSEEKLLEAERLLREKRYLRDAVVTPHRVCGKRVDVEVRTIDNWTLTPSVSVGSAGGNTRYAFEVQDLNVLGLGKELRFRSSRSNGSQETAFSYRDDNVFGSRYQFVAGLGDTDGNQSYSLEGGLPFYSSEADRAWWVTAQKDTLPWLGTSEQTDEDIPDESLEKTHFEFWTARKLVQSDYPVSRLGTGLRYVSEKAVDGNSGEKLDKDTDRRELYPFISAQWSQNRWIKRQNYLGIRKTEDINLGLSVTVEAGALLNGLGNEEDALRLELDMSQGWYGGQSDLHKASLHQIHYFSDDGADRQELSARYQYFRWLSDVDQLDLRLTGEMREGFSPVERLAVGGADGLRGYPERFQVGDRRILGLAEYRHITQWSPWSLAHVGFTGFVEGGRAWSDGDDAETLVNVGVGLLLAPTRSSRAAVNRFDISVPLTDNNDIDDFQIFVGTRLNF